VKPDVSAPGVGVVSASVGTGNGRETLSGTSMAAPHAAGVAALVLDKNPSWSGQDVKNALVNTASLAGSAVNALYPQRIRGAGLIQPGAAMDATIVMQSTSAGDTGLSFGIQEGKSFSGRTKIMVDNLTGQTKWVTLSAIANNGATLSVSPSRVRVGAFTKSVTVRLTMSRSVVSALSPASDTFLPITLGRITASVDEVPVAALPVQVIQHNRSDIEADYSKRKNTITVRNDGYGAGAADLYELLMVDRKDPGSGLDIRAVGFQAFPAYGDYLTIFAINTHNRFSNAAENEVDLWIDTTGDNIPEYLVATLDYGLVVDGYTDGQLGVFIIDLNEGTLGGYVGSAPHDGSTIYAIMLAADIGLGANKPVGRLLGVDTYPLYNDGGFDLNGGLATFNITDNQRTTGYYAELVRKQKAMFPVTTRRPLANEKISLGWMVSMVNNKSGKEQAKLIYATSGERDDD
jgi:hypothetical protein